MNNIPLYEIDHDYCILLAQKCAILNRARGRGLVKSEEAAIERIHADLGEIWSDLKDRISEGGRT